jgi:two-component system alkaline phosphatase synthesis response regulator PhoP
MPKNILVVDDDRSIHTALRSILEKAGYRIASAMDGMQGTMMARQNAPDMIILDINMPAGGGYTVFERLRQMNTTAHIPILIYSAVPGDDVAQKIPQSPDTMFLPKGASPEVILKTVTGILPV